MSFHEAADRASLPPPKPTSVLQDQLITRTHLVLQDHLIKMQPVSKAAKLSPSFVDAQQSWGPLLSSHQGYIRTLQHP